MGQELVLTNARVVTGAGVFTGSVCVYGNYLRDVDPGKTSLRGAVDLQGDYLLPGLIEMHTDNLEKHLIPRPGVEWPSALSALMAHDVQLVGAGITTVLDGIFVGEYEPGTNRRELLEKSIWAIREARREKYLRADHLLHLRCEYPDDQVVDMFSCFMDDPLLRLVSLMDHTPGQRQWTDLSKWRKYHEKDGWTEEDARGMLSRRQDLQVKNADRHRRQIVNICLERRLPLASHDDTTEEHVLEGVEQGVTISEFPTTIEAASRAHKEGLTIVMGAPNVVRNGSHSGNVSAMELAAKGYLDALSSDYAPKSLLHAAFLLHQELDMDLPEAVAKVSTNLADVLGLDDRGEIAGGKLADLVRVRLHGGVPVVRTVWRKGRQIL